MSDYNFDITVFCVCEPETEVANNCPLTVTRRPVSRGRPPLEWLNVAGVIRTNRFREPSAGVSNGCRTD